MSVTGRTTKRWGRDKSARWDPGPTNRSRSYPAVEQPAEVVPVALRRAELPGRRGAAERHLLIEGRDVLNISLIGWYTDKVSLDERQARFLRDTLNAWVLDEAV
jgi:hypothetical protein